MVTGGSRGIGRAIALRAARDGANVAILAKTAAPHPKLPGTIHSVAAEVEAAGGRGLPLAVDVRDAAHRVREDLQGRHRATQGGEAETHPGGVHSRVEEEVILDRSDHPIQETARGLGPALLVVTFEVVPARGGQDAPGAKEHEDGAQLLVSLPECARHVSQESVQLHGGMGMSEELKVSHSFRRLTVLARAYGDADHHLERFASL